MAQGVDTSAISAEAERTPSVSSSIAGSELLDRLDKVDLLIADLGQVSEFTSKAVKFADEAATEIRWNRIARLCTLITVLVILGGLSRALWVVITWDSFSALRASPGAFSTTLAALVGGGIVLAVGVSRSVFSSFSERNGGMPMPEHLKTVIDGIGTILKPR